MNNAVARAGGLLAIAVLPLATGLSGAAYQDASAFSTAFGRGLVLCSVLLAAAGVVAWLLIRDEEVATVAEPAGDVVEGGPAVPCSPGAVPCAPPVALEQRR